MTNSVALNCAYCGKSTVDVHMDHVVPRSRGGPDSPMNLVAACAPCNREKHDRLPSEWLASVPAFVAQIERKVCASVGAKLRARREWNRNHRPATPVGPGLRCFFCGKGVGRDGFIEFYDTEDRQPFRSAARCCFDEDGRPSVCGSLQYPGNGDVLVQQQKWTGFRRIALFSHAGCGPDIGYWLPFDRIGEDWESHLVHKRWWSEELAQPIDRARVHRGLARRGL